MGLASLSGGSPPPLLPSAPSTTGPEVARVAGVERIRTRLDPQAHLTGPERERLALAIAREARAHDLSPALVLAVIKVESGFDPWAVSPVGALGLMQVLPTTGLEVAQRLEIRWHGPRTLFDLEHNVRIGVAYLAELRDRYGDIRVALAAYNWGPGHIDGRIRSGRPLPERYPRLVLAAYGAGRGEAARES